MIGIGLLGLGTVGQGVVEILEERRDALKSLLKEDISIKKILVRDIHKKRNIKVSEGILTDDFQDILDEEVDIVIEVTSDLEQSYRYIVEAMNRGKHIVTANKAIVSKYFEELNELSIKNGVGFLYEASVGGGIPVLKPLKEQIVLNDIDEVQGILNGTCNYILTNMFERDLDYDEVLRTAQELGYAEADPSADVQGHDTLRKLRILATLGLQGKITEEDILLEGIDNINAFDIAQIKRLDSTIKLIGEAKRRGDGFTAVVQPMIIKNDSYFASVNGAFNSVAFKGNNVGELKFYGSGAGKLPTANAILSDVIDTIMDSHRENSLGDDVLSNENHMIQGQYYIRISPVAGEGVPNILSEISEEILAQGEYISIKTKATGLYKIYDVLRELGLSKDEYFLARFFD